MRAIILALRDYSFVDEKTGRLIEGSKLEYLDPDSAPGEGQKGLPPFSLNVDASLSATFGSFPMPGVYDLSIRRRPGKGGKAVEMLACAEFIQSVNFAEIASKARKSS